MARPSPIDPRFRRALARRDDLTKPYAELWRELIPVARRIGLPRPSYWQVRRTIEVQRRERIRRRKEIDRMVERTLAGRTPVPL